MRAAGIMVHSESKALEVIDPKNHAGPRIIRINNRASASTQIAICFLQGVESNLKGRS